jgi:hypothetical protein
MQTVIAKEQCFSLHAAVRCNAKGQVELKLKTPWRRWHYASRDVAIEIYAKAGGVSVTLTRAARAWPPDAPGSG